MQRGDGTGRRSIGSGVYDYGECDRLQEQGVSYGILAYLHGVEWG
jgi:hypothetical protein